MASIKKKTAMAGVWCAIQLIGIIIFFASFMGGIPGAVVGGVICIAMFVIGSAKSSFLECSNCGSRISSKTVNECHSCHAKFD